MGRADDILEGGYGSGHRPDTKEGHWGHQVLLDHGFEHKASATKAKNTHHQYIHPGTEDKVVLHSKKVDGVTLQGHQVAAHHDMAAQFQNGDMEHSSNRSELKGHLRARGYKRGYVSYVLD